MGNEKKRVAEALVQAKEWYPRLNPSAPEAVVEPMNYLGERSKNVAGMFDDNGLVPRVIINSQGRTWKQGSPEQLAGLIALEQSRGLLKSPLGKPFLDRFQLTDAQRQFWDGYYFPPTVNAPLDQPSRDAILKSTIMSRSLVGDTLPPKSPQLTEEQKDLVDFFKYYAKDPDSRTDPK